MTETPHIVVVDDEADVREVIEEYLDQHGFSVSGADGGEALRRIVSEQRVDLVLLDINMPGEDGLSLARFLRANYDCGVVMLTASGEVVDRIVGLEVGADDYIAKPFDPREVLARVRSVLRRMARPAGAEADTEDASESFEPHHVRFGQCVLDLNARSLTTAEGDPVPITTMEFDLLRAFAERPNRVLTRDQLLDLAHNRNWEPFDRSIDIRIARLRRKIELDPSKPETIKTIRGTGYMFVPSPPSQGNPNPTASGNIRNKPQSPET